MILSAGYMSGCGDEYSYRENIEETSSDSDTLFGGYFTVIDKWYDRGYCYIVYANDTKVKYFIRGTTAKYFGITPLYNADGTLQIYEEE